MNTEQVKQDMVEILSQWADGCYDASKDGHSTPELQKEQETIISLIDKFKSNNDFTQDEVLLLCKEYLGLSERVNKLALEKERAELEFQIEKHKQMIDKLESRVSTIKSKLGIVEWFD